MNLALLYLMEMAKLYPYVDFVPSSYQERIQSTTTAAIIIIIIIIIIIVVVIITIIIVTFISDDGDTPDSIP